MITSPTVPWAASTTPRRAPAVSDSETSIAAANEIAGKSATLRRQVLKFLVSMGTDGATDDEMQRHLTMQGSTQRPRRIELVASGHVEDLGERRATGTGRAAVVWFATLKGKLAIQEVP